MKKDSKFSRRGLLGAGLSAGATAALGGPRVTYAAPSAARAPEYLAVSMAMHIHSCFSEGGSCAAGWRRREHDGPARAGRPEHGIDVVWWTDHDWRMQAYGYYDGIAFDGTDEGGGLAVDRPERGDGHRRDARLRRRAAQPGRARQGDAGHRRRDRSRVGLGPTSGRRPATASTRPTSPTPRITIDVLAEAVGPDAELVVQVETSYRPATGGRPAGVYVAGVPRRHPRRAGRLDGR